MKVRSQSAALLGKKPNSHKTGRTHGTVDLSSLAELMLKS